MLLASLKYSVFDGSSVMCGAKYDSCDTGTV